MDFDLACQVPKAAVAALVDASIDIDTNDKKNFVKLIDCNGRVQFSEVAFQRLVDLFNDNTGDPSQEAACGEVLLHLKHCNLASLNLQRCEMIPSTAWQKLRGASWTNLREANFDACLVLQTWLRCLASSFDEVFFFRMLIKAIVTAVSLTTFGNIEHLATLKGQKSEVNSCKWSDLQKTLARGAATDCRPFILTVPF